MKKPKIKFEQVHPKEAVIEGEDVLVRLFAPVETEPGIWKCRWQVGTTLQIDETTILDGDVSADTPSDALRTALSRMVMKVEDLHLALGDLLLRVKETDVKCPT